jgi:hypothetical protein
MDKFLIRRDTAAAVLSPVPAPKRARDDYTTPAAPSAKRHIIEEAPYDDIEEITAGLFPPTPSILAQQASHALSSQSPSSSTLPGSIMASTQSPQQHRSAPPKPSLPSLPLGLDKPKSGECRFEVADGNSVITLVMGNEALIGDVKKELKKRLKLTIGEQKIEFNNSVATDKRPLSNMFSRSTYDGGGYRLTLIRKEKKAAGGGQQGGNVDGETLEGQKRRLGNLVSGQISMEKYAIAASTHVSCAMGVETFQQLVEPLAVSVVPVDWDEDSPVVVALMTGECIGEAFGKTKVRGGNRYSSFTASKAEVVFFPKARKARIWWIMD